MPIMIQVRNVPDALHRELLRRASERGQSLTAYIQELLEREVSRRPRSEVLARLRELEPVRLPRPAADYLHEARAERTEP